MEHDNQIKSAEGLAMVQQVRSCCAPYPEVTEGIDGFGHLIFQVKGKTFLMMGEDGEGASMSLRTSKETQAVLLEDPLYTKTPYIGQHGWVSVRAGALPEAEELGGIIREAYCRTAPKKLLQLVLAASPEVQ